MKIAFVHHSYQLGNGTDSLVYQYTKKLWEKGHKVTIYTLRSEGFGFSESLGKDGADVSSLVVTKLPFGNGRLNTSVFAPLYGQFWKIRKELQEYDAVISMLYPSCLLPVWPSKINTRVVHIEWGTPEGVWTTLGENLYAKIAKVGQGIACLRADKVLVPGSFVKGWVKENYGVEAKQIYLDGIDFPTFKEEDNRYNTGNILYVGRVVPYKNLESLIRAVANIKGASLTIVGNYKVFPKYTSKLLKLQKELDVRMTLAGVISDLAPYYLNCQIYCSPSKWEGFLKSDAYAYKKPMVAFDYTSSKDIIQPDITGRIVTNVGGIGYGKTLEIILGNLVKNEKECQKLGENGYKWAKETLDINKIVDNLEKEIIEN